MRLFFGAVILAGLATAQAAPNDDPVAKAVAGFYKAYESFSPPDGIPDAAAQKRFEPFISVGLAHLLADARSAEEHYERVTKAQFPPLIEGDPFTPNFEGATSFALGSCKSDSRGARCVVSLSYDPGKDKPRHWADTVWLIRSQGGWRVDDIEYDGNWDGGSRGTLAETLKDAIEHGNAAQ